MLCRCSRSLTCSAHPAAAFATIEVNEHVTGPAFTVTIMELSTSKVSAPYDSARSAAAIRALEERIQSSLGGSDTIPSKMRRELRIVRRLVVMTGGNGGAGDTGDGGGGDLGGSAGGGGGVQAPTMCFLSFASLAPSQTERAGKQQPLEATTSTSWQSPIFKHASLHSSRVRPQKCQPKLEFSCQEAPATAAAMAAPLSAS